MPRSLWSLIVFGIKAAIALVVGILAFFVITGALMGIGALVNLVGKYFGWW